MNHASLDPHAFTSDLDAFKANKITADGLKDIQQVMAFALKLAYKLIPDRALREHIASTTAALRADYDKWHAEWIKSPAYETLISRLNHHLDIYEQLLNEIDRQQPQPSSREVAEHLSLIDASQITKALDEIKDKINESLVNENRIAKNLDALPKAIHAELSTKRSGDPLIDPNAAGEQLRELAQGLESSLKLSNRAAVQHILTAKPGDPFYDKCASMREIIKKHEWKESYVFRQGKPSGAKKHAKGIDSPRTSKMKAKRSKVSSDLDNLHTAQDQHSAEYSNASARWR